MSWSDQIGFPLLSVITFLPLAGVLLILLFARGKPQVYKVISLVVTLAAFALSVWMLFAFKTKLPGHAVRRDGHLDRAAEHQVRHGRGRHRRAARVPHHAARRDRHHRQLALRQGPRGGLLHLAAAAPGGHGRRVLRHRPLPLLRVLGGHAHPDVLHHRRVGRPAARLRGDQVLPVHAHRQPAHAAGDHRGRVLRQGPDGGADVRHPGARQDGLRLPPAVLGVPRLLRGLRHQGADVPGAHLAPRRARRGAHGGLRDPGRRPPQDGRVRHAALLPALLPGRRGHVRPVGRRPFGGRDRLRRARVADAEGPQEARRLLEREPHGLRHRRHLRRHRPRRQRRRHRGRDPRHAQPRVPHGRPLPHGRLRLRAHAHAADRRHGLARQAHADRRRLPAVLRLRLAGPARAERLRRRVPQPLRRLRVLALDGGGRRPRRDPRRRLPALDVPAHDVQRPRRRRGQALVRASRTSTRGRSSRWSRWSCSSSGWACTRRRSSSSCTCPCRSSSTASPHR